MSLFRKPKKSIQRRVFSGYNEEDIENNDSSANDNNMEIDEINESKSTSKDRKKDKKTTKDKIPTKTTSLLSFDDEEEGEVFQVKKSSHSKKVMKMLDKERKKNKKVKSSGFTQDDYEYNNTNDTQENDTNIKLNKKDNSNQIHTEIRTDDFVLVVKKSEPDNVILNGRAAFCAGKNDLSSEDEDGEKKEGTHKFSHPENFKMVLESGEIPDAAMIHAARKRRQKAREQSEFIPIEEPKSDRKGNRLIRDDGEDDGSDEEERVDMSAITGVKEREERREIFYSAQQEYSGDSGDMEMNEWENQQIRKGVTGAQLVSAQDSVFSQFMIQPNVTLSSGHDNNVQLSTGALLEQAYARSCLEKPRQLLLSTQHHDNKPTGPRMPLEVVQQITERLTQLKQIHIKHYSDIDRITNDLKLLKMEEINCEQKAPLAAGKYRFYQELRGYVTDLVECLDDKVPIISDLEKRAIQLMSKRTTTLVERRRQDVRDQAKELTDSSRGGGNRKPEDDEHTRRAAEREGRRTRRRRDRERSETNDIHLDGMSSDDEVADHETNQYKSQLEQIVNEANDVFNDASDEFSEIDEILNKFELWKKFDTDSYKDAYVSLCLPKILGPIIRLKLISWSPLEENSQTDLEKMFWYNIVMKYGHTPGETEESLANDADLRLVPSMVEKIIIPKITEHIEMCWDPLSTTETFKLVGLLARLGRDYPSLRPLSKSLRILFTAILDKMKVSLDNDVFIPIFPKHMQEAKTSFFQRQFCSGLKLFRNLISWQGILSDTALKDVAISSLLNRYLLSAMRVCTPIDAISKAYIIVNTLPRVWLQSETGILGHMELFVTFLKLVASQLDKKNQYHMESLEKITKILQRLHVNL